MIYKAPKSQKESGRNVTVWHENFSADVNIWQITSLLTFAAIVQITAEM